MSDHTIRVTGRVGGEPELRFTGGGDAVASFSLAYTKRVKGDDGTWADGDTIWYSVTAWRTLGENVATSLQKGDLVTVEGTPGLDEWEDKRTNKMRSKPTITANEVGISLKWDPARSERGSGRPARSAGTTQRQAPPVAEAYDPNVAPF